MTTNIKSKDNEKYRKQVEVMPERRDLHFLPPSEHISTWHKEGPNITQFMNAMSLLFPAGERMFIDAIRSYRDDIPDPDLKKAATAFIGQEAMHSREHIEYNKLMDKAGLPAQKLDRFVWKLLDVVKTKTNKSTPLAATIALEHYTALMGDMLLRHPEMIEGSQEDYARMWQWHALEEVEHKAVAYDVYEKCIGRGPRNWVERTVAMMITTGIFWPVLMSFYYQMSRADPNCQKEGFKGHLKLANFLLGKPGFLRKMMPDFFDYFKYSFHPWQHNNAYLLERIDDLVKETEEKYQNYH